MSRVCRAWWKSSLHWASWPNPPRSRGARMRASFRSLSGISSSRAPHPGFEPAHRVRKLREKRVGTGVRDAVDRVQPQAVDVVVREPGEGVLDEEAPHLVAVGPVEVQRRAPRCPVAVGEVGAEIPQVVPLGAEVVVDHVEDDGHPAPVRGVHQPPEPLRTAVALLHREGVDTVVAPVPRAGELRHRHDLEGVDAQLAQAVEVRDHGIERPLGREGPHVQLVLDLLLEGDPPPGGVPPGERRGIDHLRRPVNAERLKARCRVGPLRGPVEDEEVPGSRRHLLDDTFVIPALPARQLDMALTRRNETHRDPLARGARRREIGSSRRRGVLRPARCHSADSMPLLLLGVGWSGNRRAAAVRIPSR